MTATQSKHWLMKAEPNSRIVQGKDVKFSVDDFAEMGVSPWDGVRSFEARNIMRDQMKLGDKVLFYHSNCKAPGVQAIAEVVKEGYPDHTAFDPNHPYYDAASDKSAPKWFMVDVKFVERFPHPPTLVLIKTLASAPSLPAEVKYIGEQGFAAIKSMQLVNRGRLSVQPVTSEAFHAVLALGHQGGWSDLIPGSAAASKRQLSTKKHLGDEDEPTKQPSSAASDSKRKRSAGNQQEAASASSKVKRSSLKGPRPASQSTRVTRSSARVK